MGVNDAQEMLVSAKAEVVKLEKEVAEQKLEIARLERLLRLEKQVTIQRSNKKLREDNAALVKTNRRLERELERVTSVGT